MSYRIVFYRLSSQHAVACGGIYVLLKAEERGRGDVIYPRLARDLLGFC